MERIAITVEEAARALGISRSQAYQKISEGVLPSMRIGKSIRVPLSALKEWAAERTSIGGLDKTGAVRGIRDSAREIYKGQLAAYQNDLERAKTTLEASVDWMKVSEEDRADLAGQLGPGVPEAPATGKEMAELKVLLVRRAQVPGLQARLLDELHERLPVVIKDGPDETEEADATEVDIAQLVPSDVLKSPEDLRAWLAKLETQIGEMLKSAPVRLRVGQ